MHAPQPVFHLNMLPLPMRDDLGCGHVDFSRYQVLGTRRRIADGSHALKRPRFGKSPTFGGSQENHQIERSLHSCFLGHASTRAVKVTLHVVQAAASSLAEGNKSDSDQPPSSHFLHADSSSADALCSSEVRCENHGPYHALADSYADLLNAVLRCRPTPTHIPNANKSSGGSGGGVGSWPSRHTASLCSQHAVAPCLR